MSTRRSLLIVGEDLAETRALATDLGGRGWRVERSGSRKDAVERAMLLQPDAVVTQLRLGDTQPFAFARTLRSCVEHDLVVIGIAAGARSVESMARASGYDAVFELPVETDALASFLESELC